MMTTQRSESINAMMNRFLDSKTSLSKFLTQFEECLAEREKSNTEACMKLKYNIARLRTRPPFEEQASKRLTQYARDLYADEIIESGQY
ncbi:hypothetical protein PsorP6_017476 [Peronosclerospora sorghi]|uniref:Uncharacterized protein n=1 Tax=Peronosclerospora sorghi TaxID=230839 RepID=A0ACC0WMX2_9STRA|nr:hypothetical protein PsorP6_017476 [Peronosclerospora sorghi]